MYADDNKSGGASINKAASNSLSGVIKYLQLLAVSSLNPTSLASISAALDISLSQLEVKLTSSSITDSSTYYLSYILTKIVPTVF